MKGLVDDGVQKITSVSVHHQYKIEVVHSYGDSEFPIPVINLEDINETESLCNEIIKKIGDATPTPPDPQEPPQVCMQILWMLDLKKIPRIFIKIKLEERSSNGDSKLSIPLINLEGMNENESLRNKIVKKVEEADENWGFFQIVNHGISSNTLDRMIEGARGFHDQDPEVKKKFYSRDNRT
nr:deacetoxyvindoline 4-hydroxylase-like [Ziziphus jujuba var. spinosa]